MMLLRKIMHVFYLVSISIICSYCTKEPIIPVSELINKASEYNGKIIIVDGCYARGSVDTNLYPCGVKDQDEDILIEYLSFYENQKIYLKGYESSLKKRTRKPSREEIELTKQLGIMSDYKTVKVVLEGEFRYSKIPEFGINRKLKYLFVVHHVLRVEKFNPPIGNGPSKRTWTPTNEGKAEVTE